MSPGFLICKMGMTFTPALWGCLAAIHRIYVKSPMVLLLLSLVLGCLGLTRVWGADSTLELKRGVL